MNSSGQDFLEQLSGLPPNTFDSQFSRNARRLGLGTALSRNELKLLYDAAFLRVLCNIAFNGLGVYGGEIRPERERTRNNLELKFMAARDMFQASPGWQQLNPSRQSKIEQIFLKVAVDDANLAP